MEKYLSRLSSLSANPRIHQLYHPSVPLSLHSTVANELDTVFVFHILTERIPFMTFRRHFWRGYGVSPAPSCYRRRVSIGAAIETRNRGNIWVVWNHLPNHFSISVSPSLSISPSSCIQTQIYSFFAAVFWSVMFLWRDEWIDVLTFPALKFEKWL